jgi:hypothetical protein
MIVATSWPQALIALGGIALVGAVLCVAMWQIFATGRAHMQSNREKAYRKLAEDSAETQVRISTELERMNAELTELRRQTAELARVLQEVE